MQFAVPDESSDVTYTISGGRSWQEEVGQDGLKLIRTCRSPPPDLGILYQENSVHNTSMKKCGQESDLEPEPTQQMLGGTPGPAIGT